MIDSGRNVTTAELSAEICVIGAGPAGIVLASELSQQGRDVIVIEAGGEPYDRERRSNALRAARDHARGAQSLTRGRNRGEPYFPLRFSRARGIGGSTNALKAHGLRARQLDAVDFEDRGFGGWPITYSEVARYFDRAAAYCGIEGPAAADLASLERNELARQVDHGELAVAPFQYGPRDTFTRLVAELSDAPRLRLLTDTAVTSLRVATGSDRANVVEAKALRGPSFRVRAGTFVIACGGVDNARLLAASRELHPAMGRAVESLGRYFMEHPHYIAGFLLPSSAGAASRLVELFGPASEAQRMLTLSEAATRERGLLRLGVAGVPVSAHSRSEAVRAAGQLARILPYGPFAAGPRARQIARVLRGLPAVAGAVASRVRPRAREAVFTLPVMAEQQPNPDSRVLLSDRTDQTGLPLADLDWRLSARDFEDAGRSLEVIADAIELHGLGTIEPLYDGGRPDIVGGGWHHMGTTRMSSTPDGGVVDPSARVHGLSNVYVAGSSVFPTGGYANPTLTLTALAVRLADQLAGDADGGGGR